jgi:hypothetical protein
MMMVVMMHDDDHDHHDDDNDDDDDDDDGDDAADDDDDDHVRAPGTAGPRGMASLAEALTKNESLTALHLQSNRVSALGAVALSKVLHKLPSMTFLDLRCAFTVCPTKTAGSSSFQGLRRLTVANRCSSFHYLNQFSLQLLPTS